MSTRIEHGLSKVDEGEEVVWDGATTVVQSPCDTPGGNWLCVTHDATFGNNMQKDSHISNGEHTLAWLCRTHGLEVP